MTQPPIDPAGREPVIDASPTEPLPVMTPPPAFAFTPVVPGPEPGAEPAPGLPAAPSPNAAPGTRTGGSSRIINIALGAAILVGAVGIAFAAGRATSPASNPANNTANLPVAGDVGAQGSPVAGDVGAKGGLAPGNGNGNGTANGNGRPGGDVPGDVPGNRGLGRGFAGLGLSGTVTAVTTDRITIQTDAGPVITLSLDGTTTYHQQADASASDVKTGTRVQVAPSGRTGPTPGSNGEIDLGTAGDITIVP